MLALLASLASLVLSAIPSAIAAPIEVDNFSFETPTLGAGGWNNNLDVWLGRDGFNSGDAFIEYIGGFRSEGNQHIGMANGYFVFQNLGVPYEANTLYTLTVGVGYRNPNQSGTESFSIVGLTVLDEEPGPDNVLDGFDANDQLDQDEVLASNAVSVDSVEINNNGVKVHQFTDVVVEFATGANPPDGNIVIFLGDDNGGARSHFDNVRLEAVGNDDPDGDEIPTEWETGEDRGVARGLDPAVDDGGADPDGDGLTNFAEFQKGTHPQLADTDADGINDGAENTTDPLNPDSDGDTLLDGAELTVHLTNPNDNDSDDDTFEDQAEVAAGSNPLAADSKPFDDGDVLVGVNFVGGNANSPGAPVSGQAGVIQHDNWNNLEGGSGLPSIARNASDENTLLRVSFATNGPGAAGAEPGDNAPNEQLMHGVLLPRGSGAGGDDVITEITIRNLPYPAFDLYLYIVSDADGEATFTINDDIIDVLGVQSFDGEFVEVAEDGGSGNYIKVEGLSGSTLVITGNTVAGDVGIAGFQIVRSTADADGDGMPDVWEEANGLDPETNDAALDKDADGATNLAEYQNGTDPQKGDSDNDGLLDGVETNTGTWVDATNTGTNPRSADTDGDGLKDGVETNTGVVVSATNTGTNPLKADTDGDGATDGTEVTVGTNPFDPASFPPFPVPIAYWSFDDGKPVTADLMGNAPGTLNGSAAYVAGPTGGNGDQAIQFDGVDSSVTTEVPLIDGLTEFTIVGWVRFDNVQPGRTGLFGQNDLAEIGANTAISWWMPDGGTVDTGVSTAPEWLHLAFIGSADGRFAYINGELVGENGTAPSGGTSAFNFNIGGDGIWDATGNFFEGEIDDVAVWELALSEDQVKQLADGSMTPIGPPAAGGVFQITDVSFDAATRTVSITFPSVPGASYAGEVSENLVDWLEFEDIGADGTESTLQQTSVPDDIRQRHYRVKRTD